MNDPTAPIPLRRVAAFDFDGTITRWDTVVPFLRRVAGTRRVVRALAPEVFGLLRSRGRGASRDDAKQRVIARTLTGHTLEEVERRGTEYGARLASRGIRRELRERIAWHRDQGHDVVIVSASLAPYLAEVARRLAVDAVLCTELEVDGSGRLTGRLDGANCRGPEKAARLERHLAGETVELWAYGDSRGDEELLAMADHPVRVARRVVGRVLPR